MATIKVQAIGGEVFIGEKVFLSLLDLSPIKHYKAYKEALEYKEITLKDLKELARKACVPYPLFFAPQEKVNIQIKDQDSNLYNKIPTKKEIQIGFRGSMNKGDIELIVKDLARKQEFLKKRILKSEVDNDFIGSITKSIKKKLSKSQIAQEMRDYFGIDLKFMRKLSKSDVVSYLCKKSEDKNILISLSSYNYMPQNIDKNLGLSGICIKDKKFPYIFVNTRDGDENPLILETEGRQTFTIVAMWVCLGMNKFILNTKNGKKGDESLRKVFSLVGEILIPPSDLKGISINDIDDLKKNATHFKVTPSMLLVRLRELELIGKKDADIYREKLRDEIKVIESKPKRQVLPINGYSKYNGERLSREVIRAYNANKITPEETKNVLFRRGKMDFSLFGEYITKYK